MQQGSAAALLLLATCLILAAAPRAQDAAATGPVSEASESCVFCHENLNPGLVGDWRRSRHARVTPAEALKREPIARRMSVDKAPAGMADHVVGCAECHTLSPDTHPDTVEHQGHRIHTVVTPRDCATCHPTEATEFDQNLMSRAHENLVRNQVYQDLMRQVNEVPTWRDGSLRLEGSHGGSDPDSCLQCHGTEVKVLGKEKRKTSLGEMEFPILSGWPNQGVGRVNPDQSRGTCSACHTRHEFSLAMARKPYTCAQCHKGPDVPAFQVYEASKHGALFKTHGSEWNFDAVPWVPGRDFTAPTCATCHMSLLANESGTMLAPRTHRMNDRLWVRLFGLPYAHPHPKDPSTHTIRNQAGLQLPTNLDGTPVAAALIDAAEQAQRKRAMQQVCRTCHSQSWVNGQFERLDQTIAATNAATLTATQLLQAAWANGVARGPAEQDSMFNESIERMWVEQWLFFANSTRFASAMMGADYGVFAGGRWQLSRNLRDMEALVRQGPRK